MFYLNLSTVEKLIFFDKAVQQHLPSNYFSIFEQWRLSKRIPGLKTLGQQALLDLLNILTDEDVSTLELYFDDKIILERLNYSVATNLKIPLENTTACQQLCAVEGFNYFGTWRDKDYLYISLWR